MSVCDTDGHLDRLLICSRIIFQLGEGLGKQGVVLVAVGAVGIRQPCLPCMDTLEIVLGNSVVFIDEILHLLLHALRIGKIVRKEGVELFFRKHRLLVYLTRYQKHVENRDRKEHDRNDLVGKQLFQFILDQ